MANFYTTAILAIASSGLTLDIKSLAAIVMFLIILKLGGPPQWNLKRLKMFSGRS